MAILSFTVTLSWLHSILQTSRFFHWWKHIIFLFVNPPTKKVKWLLKENFTNKSITSATVIQEALTHPGLSWLTHGSNQRSPSATKQQMISPGKLLWWITTLQGDKISRSHHTNKKNWVIRSGCALSRLVLYKLQSDYVDEIHELNLSAVQWHLPQSLKRIYAGVRGQLKKGWYHHFWKAHLSSKVFLFAVETIRPKTEKPKTISWSFLRVLTSLVSVCPNFLFLQGSQSNWIKARAYDFILPSAPL